MKNRWRALFFFILGLNITGFILAIYLIFTPIKENPQNQPFSTANKQAVNFQIKTNKSDLNEVIAHYMEKELLKGGIHYDIRLEDEVELYGTIPVFSQNVSMELTFEPEALENGDLILRQKKMKIGDLPLPVSHVMKFIQDRYQLPEWVHIQPKEEIVYVSLENMKLDSDFRVKVDQFDLQNDKITFTLAVPTGK